LAELTLQAAGGGPLFDPVAVETFSDTTARKKAALDLKTMIDKHGSDKASPQNYHLVYGPILAGLEPVCDLLEIGLGTNNTDVASNMGPQGRPGASLRAFSEFRPQARLYGADVDRRILFAEDNIKTFFVDQTDPKTFEELARRIGHGFDLVIDDGLHSPNANLATMAFALRYLKPGGWFVVEDISAGALSIWQIVGILMPKNYRCWIVSSSAALMFTVHRESTGSQTKA
jgi:hypothetical protein